jgi:hypothetical protein
LDEDRPHLTNPEDILPLKVAAERGSKGMGRRMFIKRGTALARVLGIPGIKGSEPFWTCEEGKGIRRITVRMLNRAFLFPPRLRLHTERYTGSRHFQKAFT